MNRSEIPEHFWKLMSRADREALLEDSPAAAAAKVRYLRRWETQEQKVFNAWLNNKVSDRRLYAINPRSDKPSTIRKGHPDYTIFLPGIVLLLEMKVEGGKLSPEQVQCAELLSELGYAVKLPHSASDAITMVKKFL